jgi:hypothetical protein
VGTARIELTDDGFLLLKGIIEEADKYVYLASFLFYEEELANLLIEKSKAGAHVEILTTPPEAAGTGELKTWSTAVQEKLRSAGVLVIPCRWEVGQPQRTTSTFAGGRQPTWFALHMKFLVTDKHAAVMSADLTRDFQQRKHWDSFVVYDEPSRIVALRDEYENIKTFYADVEHHVSKDYIDATVESRRLLRGYPLRTIEPSFADGFYILPLDTYGRKVVEKVVDSSEKFIYCAYETFYDDQLSFHILRKLITSPRIDFRLLTPPLTVYQQNPLKARASFVQLASHNAEIRSLENVRAKIMIADKAVISGSFDLSVMGIGKARAEKGLKLWVESTEILDINTNPAFISRARSAFLDLYGRAAVQYGKWFEKDAERSLRSAGAKLIAREAKEALGLLIFDAGRQANQRIRKISLIAVEIAKLSSTTRPYVMVQHITGAEQIVLHEERGELDSKSIRGILELPKDRAFLKRAKHILSG